MSTTPPPPSRLRTPPTPLHGSRYDNYEPYSPPRRSNRVSSMRMRHESPTVDAASASTSTPLTSTPRKTLQRTMSSQTSQTLSPPTSPDLSELRHATPAHPSTSVRRHLFTSRQHLSIDPNSTSGPSDLDARPSPAMLPTPSKTPRKQPGASMPTARILNFKPSSLDNVMPTPRKQRKSRLTLYDEDAPEPEKITVFTDTRDRIPDVDHSEDNPFLGPRKRESRAKSTKKPVHASQAEMDEAVRNEEGLIYVFRGKKIFRPFASSSRDTQNNEQAPLDQGDLKRKAGIGAQRPITRSTVKPRLLWPSEEQLDDKHARDAAIDEDEEADTDIEQEHMPLPLPKTNNDLITPVVNKVAPPGFVMTPPSTHRATRSASKKLSFVSSFETISESAETNTPASPAPTPARKSGPKKTSPFESWQRKKSNVSGAGTKRALSPQPEEEIGRKRTRGAAATEQS